jgi:hypothetical protein
MGVSDRVSDRVVVLVGRVSVTDRLIGLVIMISANYCSKTLLSLHKKPPISFTWLDA